MLRRQWDELRDQLQANPRLRVALWAIVAILWLYALLLGVDAVPGLRAQLNARQAELAQLEKIEPAAMWQQREADVRSQVQALEAMGWDAARAGLATAEVQDWLRQTAGKAGLNLREVRTATTDAAVPAPADGVASRFIRLRVSVDFSPLALAAFLHELTQVERGVVVERLQFNASVKPATAEIDLRIPLRNREGGT